MARIQIIEGLSMPGSPERENDDALGATSSIAFVLDGVTSVSDGELMPGKSDAAWVAHAVRDILVKHGPGDAGDLRGLLARTAEEIGRRFEAERLRPPTARYELPWTTISLVAVTPGRLHIAFVGDSRALIETPDDHVHNFGVNPSRSALEAKLSAKMIAARKESVTGGASIPESVLAELRRGRETVNTDRGYWLMGTDPRVGAHATVTSIALDGPATVLLATDGFYALVEDYRRYGDREPIATAQAVGLKILGRELRHIEDDDPHGERYPRMKKSDDATALLVRVEP